MRGEKWGRPLHPDPPWGSVGNAASDIHPPMPAFKGQADYSVDAKGRVAIPAKMRSCLRPEANETFVITRGFDACINAYPLDTWQGIEGQIASLNEFQPKTRHFKRIFLMWADEVQLDGQGRIRLTDQLREFAGLNGQARIIGSLDHLEIWDPDRFEDHVATQVGSYEDLAADVMGGF